MEISPRPERAAKLIAREGGKTRYAARVRHWTVPDRETHEKMGFHQGWGICADRLAALAARI